MTDTELNRRKAICDVAGVSEIGELSDGFHTFNGLYEQRMILFAALVKAYRDNAWKSYRHEDGEYCFGGGWFIVGIDTPEGSYTYHYEDNYFSLFDCKELERGKHWDGHTEKDVTRLLSLPSAQPEQRWIPVKTRPMTDEEREYYEEYYGHLCENEAVMFDCPMPDDEQEVWVCSECGNVWQDACVVDIEIGLEGNGDWFDIVAWMPYEKPQPYSEGKENR